MATKKRAIKKVIQESDDTSETEELLPTRPKALVFISHDSRDADLAEAFANLLTDVSAGTLKSFRSSDKRGTSGIEFGTEWYTAIMSQLDGATDVVALFTSQSVDRPWILYEAGVAKGKLGRTVFGLALGIPLEKVATGPFGQFQNCGDDEDSLTKVVMQLLQRNPDASPREEAVLRQVKQFRENILKILATRGKAKELPASTEEQNTAKLFEELKAMIRELPSRVDDRVRVSSDSNASRKKMFVHPGIMEELAFHPRYRKTKDGSAISWLMIISIFRNDLPWVYELGLTVYQAMLGGKISQIRATSDQFLDVLKITNHSPFGQKSLRSENDDLYFLLRELPEILMRLVSSIRHQTGHNKDSGINEIDSPENS